MLQSFVTTVPPSTPACVFTFALSPQCRAMYNITDCRGNCHGFTSWLFPLCWGYSWDLLDEKSLFPGAGGRGAWLRFTGALLLKLCRSERIFYYKQIVNELMFLQPSNSLMVIYSNVRKRSGRPRKSWDEVIKNDRKKLDMDSADPQNRSEWRGRLRGRLVKKPNPR